MRKAFLCLHLSIVLAGTTGVFGRAIDLSPVMLVWWRALIAGSVMAVCVHLLGRLQACSKQEITRYVLLGIFLSYQWMLFYAAIKSSNVSIGVVTFSTIGFFTAIFEPLICKRSISLKEVAYSVLTIAGIALIFQFDSRYRLGIVYGTLSAAGAALIAICMKQFRRNKNAETVLTWQFAGAFVGASLLVPVFVCLEPTAHLAPAGSVDIVNLVIFSTVVTLGMYALQMVALKSVSAFTMNLSYNLEPIYSIAIAMVLFGEAKELGASFWVGLALIALSVGLQTASVVRSAK